MKIFFVIIKTTDISNNSACELHGSKTHENEIWKVFLLLKTNHIQRKWRNYKCPDSN